jgi:transposase
MKKEEVKKGISKFATGIPVFNHHAAGIDIGDTIQCVAVGDGNGGHEVKTTTGFTCDLHEIVNYLVEKEVTTAAMESTGIYWLALYLMLEEAGIDVFLVNAKHVKNVTGRKKDDTDAIWIQKLHTCGLLQKSFQPDNEMRALRDYTRQRRNLITMNSDTVRRMQKALELMNIKIHTVIADILGKTGMRMIKAILAGETDPQKLAELCDVRIKAPKEEIIKSLEGIWKEEYLFMLQQAVDHYEFHMSQINNCDEKIKNQLLKQVAIVKDGDISEIENPTKKKSKVKPRKNELNFDVLPYLSILTTVDLSQIPGLGDTTVLELISEIGTDMSKWKNYKHFAAWLNLAPNSKISGGKILSSKRMKKKNKAGQILKQAASTISNSKDPLGDYYRKMRSKLGGKGAVTATAHKLARIIYTMLLNKTEFNSEIIEGNQKKYTQDKILRLEKLIAKLKAA